MLQRTRFKLFTYSALLIIAIGLLTYWLLLMAAQGHDYERLGQMKVLESELNRYFLNFNTYEIPGCPLNSPVNFCVGAGLWRLKTEKIIDPVNNGRFRFIVIDLSPDDFQISFALETGVAGLSAGDYVLRREGIGR